LAQFGISVKYRTVSHIYCIYTHQIKKHFRANTSNIYAWSTQQGNCYTRYNEHLYFTKHGSI